MKEGVLVRLRNFIVQMAFASIAAILILLITKESSVAVMYILFHLVLSIIEDRQTVRGLKLKKKLVNKYPVTPKNDLEFDLEYNTVILKDSFIRDALIDIIPFSAYTVRKEKYIKILELYYSSVMAGEYTVNRLIITDAKIIPDSDGPDDYRVGDWSEVLFC